MSEIDVCKYKFQNAEKFDGKAYCTCLNKLCEDIAFVCEDNCQIYEDYKQLQAKEQEIKLAKEMLIQNDCKTNSNTLPQIIEEFMSDNLLDAQDDEGYTIPVFKQVEDKLETLEDLEQECKALEKRVQAEIHLRNKYVNLFKKAREIYLRTSKGNLRLVSENEVINIKEAEKYKQALDEVKEYCELDNLYHGDLPFKTHFDDILDIINKAKENK